MDNILNFLHPSVAHALTFVGISMVVCFIIGVCLGLLRLLIPSLESLLDQAFPSWVGTLSVLLGQGYLRHDMVIFNYKN